VTTIDRVKELIDHLRASGRTQEDIASMFGRSQGWVSQVVSGKIRDVAGEPLRNAATKLRLVPGYFEGPGPLADYLKRTDRDSDLSPYAAVEHYLAPEAAGERPPVSEEHARELRAIRWSGEVTVGMAAAQHREMIARDKGKSVTKPEAITPSELPAGKRKIGPARKR
jgi:transcriptional regulator with XRE-family HTH domain